VDVQVYTLNAFAKEKHGGNPAGVVLHADSMFEEEMQKVARKIGFSETAFVEKSNHADFKVRFFTPNSEVDLCGHATIATFYLMVSQKLISCGTYTLETKAGILEVNVKEDGNVFLAQALPQFYEEIDKRTIADSLHISPDELVCDLPIQIVSTGLRDILIPIKNIDVLKKINPDFNQIAEISKKYNVIGYHLFTLDTQTSSVAQCRNFAPLFDIPEESATGTSNGALICYLYKHGKLTADQAQEFIFEQGYTMNRPSEIKARLLVNDDKQIVKVEVGGMASNIELKKVKI
jgi:PhzF family phenazine biosynthesis protein